MDRAAQGMADSKSRMDATRKRIDEVVDSLGGVCPTCGGAVADADHILKEGVA